jgi:hypothetical protein
VAVEQEVDLDSIPAAAKAAILKKVGTQQAEEGGVPLRKGRLRESRRHE